MCNHEVKRIIATTGTHYHMECLECGEKFSEEKNPKKKTILDKLFRR